MVYLVTQMFVCLLVVFLLGLILGWLLCKICKGCKARESCGSKSRDHDGPSVAVEPAAPAVVVDMETHADDEDGFDLDSNVDLDGEDYGIESLEGVGPKTGDLFRGYDIATVGDYLRKLNTPARRAQAAADLGILIKPLHEWASMSDLLRVEGVDHQMAELACAAGVETVDQLAECDAQALVADMEKVNNAGKQLIAPEVPSVDDVSDWIAQARGMNAVVMI